jgi:hypothetical protein
VIPVTTESLSSVWNRKVLCCSSLNSAVLISKTTVLKAGQRTEMQMKKSALVFAGAVGLVAAVSAASATAVSTFTFSPVPYGGLYAFYQRGAGITKSTPLAGPMAVEALHIPHGHDDGPCAHWNGHTVC